MEPSSGSDALPGLFAGYDLLDGTFDELLDVEGRPHAGLERVVGLLDEIGRTEFRRRQALADASFMKGGVTFSVYADRRGTEKIFPFDLIPRVVSATDWVAVERGLEQRVTALNLFLQDVYTDQRILAEGIVPRELVESSEGYLPELRDWMPRSRVPVVIAGIDLVRGSDGEFMVLEDNVRVPSGVSYVLENRAMLKRVLPRVFSESNVLPVDDYAIRLRDALRELSPVEPEETTIVVLTPGPFNSAYFEHSFLARRMGCHLVSGEDLFVDSDRVFVKTTQGPKPVHVIYRRIDDEFLDPKVFRSDSLLGVAGLTSAWHRGNVALANGLGNGVADDKSIYPLVPDMIRFYLSEEPVLAQVPTYVCSREGDLAYVLDHLDELVVKEVAGSGGYGMLMGPSASKREIAEFKEKLAAHPRGFIAQPRVELSTCPTWCRSGIAPRRVDLRPYVVTGRSSWVLPGGLTRVALREGSYVVNSSQGGGSKDTWVLAPEADGAAE